MESLKQQVLEANLLLPKYGLVAFTWGNVSGIDRASNLVVIKPSGVSYEGMTAEDLVIVNLDGKTIEGDLNPSSDTSTHIELYKAFPHIGGIVHTHSRWATSFAQAGRPIEPTGTTHADYFFGRVPCTRLLTPSEIAGNYEKETGKAIIETIANLDSETVPAVLVQKHGSFCWGKTVEKAIETAVVLEEVAFMQYHALMINPDLATIQKELLDKHYLRKHGK
ncbi:MAG: L-ribulose-5-phosphate 4-epimerase, partial [Anaerolineaceae bacterium]|nr:L-ribulose-5-phosphate 4-epimerase [Anaerolineaceae bacterium]